MKKQLSVQQAVVRDPLCEKIIDYIRRNRVSTTEVADCLGKTGALEGVRPLHAGMFCVGRVFWCYAHDNTNWTLHRQLRGAKEGQIVVAEGLRCGGRALFGDLVSKFLVLYRQVRGIVVCGRVRDAHRLLKERWPIWCEGVTPVGCFNNRPVRNVDADWLTEREKLYRGAIAVCDDSGVVVVGAEYQTTAFLRKLEAAEAQEDLWYECIDRRKWDTFETVCQRRRTSQR